ncbi:MAG: HU family DNA-binding protein [Nitrospirae bacterium]|nr:HU family DNA-binding protein [Nitrospirota bacterium]
MTKSELVDKITLLTGLSRPTAGRVLDSALDAITAEMKKGRKIILLDFGTFFISKRVERKGRNPKTGEAIRIPAARVPKFTAVKELREAVN